VLVERRCECEVCVRIARRYLRLGKTAASTLAVGGAAGIGLALLMNAPHIGPAQWLGILLVLQSLWLTTWIFVWLTQRTLRLGGIAGLFGGVVATAAIAWQVLQTSYTVALFPDHAVAAYSETWWYLFADGVGWAIAAALIRELYFVELLDSFASGPHTHAAGSASASARTSASASA
jgi:hypothetical protein